MSLTEIVAIGSELLTLLGFAFAFLLWVRKITDGQKCQLRSEMLRTYYHNRESKKIRQYEYENFVFLYEAYKALKGNSFIDKIYEDVESWEIIS